MILKRLDFACGDFRRIASGFDLLDSSCDYYAENAFPIKFDECVRAIGYLRKKAQISLLNEVPRERKINITERLMYFPNFALSHFYQSFRPNSASQIPFIKLVTTILFHLTNYCVLRLNLHHYKDVLINTLKILIACYNKLYSSVIIINYYHFINIFYR